jgi:tetratricopeptide (TPR) repeat protein
MGMYDEAEAMYRESLSAETKARGGEHAGPLETVAKLAEILRLQKKTVEEEKLLAQLTASLENALEGEGQPYIPHFRSVGERFLKAEQYGQAEAIFRIVVRVREKALGPENAETVSSLQQLANTFFCSKRYREASEIFQRLLATSEKLYGPEAQENVKYTWRLANSLHHDRKNMEAYRLYQRLLPRLIKSPA